MQVPFSNHMNNYTLPIFPSVFVVFLLFRGLLCLACLNHGNFLPVRVASFLVCSAPRTHGKLSLCSPLRKVSALTTDFGIIGFHTPPSHPTQVEASLQYFRKISVEACAIRMCTRYVITSEYAECSPPER